MIGYLAPFADDQEAAADEYVRQTAELDATLRIPAVAARVKAAFKDGMVAGRAWMETRARPLDVVTETADAP